jgi:hypothetical protein
MKRSNQSRRKGATMIESTLVLTLYVIMIFSIFDFGYVLFLHSTIVNRASTAARYGIFGLTASNVSATRSGSGTTADRVVVTVSGYPFSFVTPWHAGKHTGQTITVAYPVENN